MGGYHCVRMEDFGAQVQHTDEFCKAKVAGCDLFLCILGARYGSSPEGSERSYTEHEYDAALGLGKPRLIFVSSEDFPVPARLMESEEKQAKQRAFRERVSRNQLRATFCSPGELAQGVMQAVHNWYRDELEAQTERARELQTTTNLLFPLVTNQSGFDAGISIANISRGPQGSRPEAGLCKLFYYGSTSGGGGAPPPQVPCVLPAGELLMLTLSGGNAAQNVAATPGFQGYMIAICHFPAQGFAFITDGFGGVPTLGSGYVATALPTTW